MDLAETLAAVDGVHACTDITGFGLIGHASEMAAASHVTIAIDATTVPVFPGVLEMVGENKSGGMKTNQEHFGPGVDFGIGVSAEIRDLFFDPQTSGGLLIAVSPATASSAIQLLEKAGISAKSVGLAEAAGTHRIRVSYEFRSFNHNRRQQSTLKAPTLRHL